MRIHCASILSALLLALGLPFAAIAGPTPGGADVDSDGVENAFDNCSSRSNPNQKDSDHDGCGNTCDGDFDQNGVSGLSDYAILVPAFGATIGAPTYKASVDIECNGVIGLTEYGFFISVFGTATGPSGLTSSGRNLIACP